MYIFVLNGSNLLDSLLFPILVNVLTFLLTELILKPLCEKILNFFKDLKKIYILVDFLPISIYHKSCAYTQVFNKQIIHNLENPLFFN